MSQPIGVAIVVLNTYDKVLLGRRLGGYKAGYLGCPGGRIEHGELVLDCAKRELKEETGLVLKDLSYLGVVKETQEKNDFVHFVCVARVTLENPTVMEPDKCEEWKWFEPKFLPPKTLPGHIAAIYLWRERLQFFELDQSVIPELLTVA